MPKKIVVSSFTALAIALGGAVFAGQNEMKTDQMLKDEAKALSGDQGYDIPSTEKDPVSDPAKQMKTEQMLKDEAKALSGDQGYDIPSTEKDPVSDPEAQDKTEKMLEEEKGALQGR